MVEKRDLHLSGLIHEHHDVLAYQRVAAEVGSAVGHGRDPGLDEKYRRYRSPTGELLQAAESRHMRPWRKVSGALQTYDVLVWPAEPTESYGRQDNVAGNVFD